MLALALMQQQPFDVASRIRSSLSCPRASSARFVPLAFLVALGGCESVLAQSRAHAPADAGAAHAPAAPRVAAATPLQFDAAGVVFRPAPPSMPKGVEMAVLEGDPQQPGIFTLRLKAPPGFLLPPHTHPVAERVTVISGSFAVGFGTQVERASARTFSAGAFYVNPPGVPHYVFSDSGAVVQITGMGPWKVEPAAAK
jgi:quercetin dioxygenase-like cupin family protein